MPPRFLISNPRVIFGALLVFRIINSYFVQTFFQPDEYFQSLEPAWQWAFGPGSGAWITWEWREQLRSSLHPLLFASGYKAAEQILISIGASRYTQGRVLAVMPRLMQAVFAAVTDLYTWRLARRVLGRTNQYSRTALGLTILSPWQWFCSVRTFSNCLETTLTVVALDSFPWNWFEYSGNATSREKDPNGLSVSLLCAAAACVLRPTNIVIWFTISACIVLRCGFSGKTWTLITRAATYGSLVLGASVGIDRAYYNDWTFPPLRFLYFNIVQSIAGFYGRNRPDYYLTEGLPLLLMTATPFAIVGLWQGLHSFSSSIEKGEPVVLSIRFVLSAASVVSITSLTLISHKEVRFIYPLLPMLHVLAAKPLAQFFSPLSDHVRRGRLILLWLGIAVNVGIAMYVSLVHQRGVIDVMHYLRHRQEARMMNGAYTGHALTKPNISVGFLMPCHSTPWRTHLEYPEIRAWALTCDPPVNKTQQEREAYLDEADIFYNDPPTWIKANMEDVNLISSHLEPTFHPRTGQRPWPGYLVFFEQLTPVLQPILKGTKYKECRRFFNTHWHDDGRRKGDVIVWCMREWQTST